MSRGSRRPSGLDPSMRDDSNMGNEAVDPFTRNLQVITMSKSENPETSFYRREEKRDFVVSISGRSLSRFQITFVDIESPNVDNQSPALS
jgi:hypothetical protein